MALIYLIPLHLSKGKTLAKCLTERTDYIKDPDKTALTSYYECDPDFAVSQFALSKHEYSRITGKEQKSDVIAYLFIQSFKPGEISPEDANRIGYEFTKRLTKGDFAFMVCTHTDRPHIHNHIIWNSTSLDCKRKFREGKIHISRIYRLSNQICAENGLSVLMYPDNNEARKNLPVKTKSPTDYHLLRSAIDDALGRHPADMDELIGILSEAGFEPMRRKLLYFKPKGRNKFISLRSLGKGYSEEEILAAVKNGVSIRSDEHDKGKAVTQPGLILRLKEKIGSGEDFRFDQSVRVAMLKQMADTLVFAEEHGFMCPDDFTRASAELRPLCNEQRNRIKELEDRLEKIKAIKMHARDLARTEDVWNRYRGSGFSKQFASGHEGDLILHRAAEKALRELGIKEPPSVSDLNTEYSELLSEKNAAYGEYRKIQDEIKGLALHRANLEYMLRQDTRDERADEHLR